MSRVVTTPLRRLAGSLARTWRLEVRGEAGIRELRAKGVPVLYAVWHGQLLAPLWHRRQQGITLLVSAHNDGGKLAEAAQAWGYHVVRGSSTHGAVAGFLALLRALKRHGIAAVTPDGPQGPAQVVKLGVVAAARHAGAAIIPVGVAARPAWRLRSWDRFLVPKPFAHVRIVYGKPVVISSTGDQALHTSTSLLASHLGAAHEEAACSP
jgi:lysophospholipid acyltransferase (LPLAT)-like uncharacterized protein